MNRWSKGQVACSNCARGKHTCYECRGEAKIHTFGKEVIKFVTDERSPPPTSPAGIRVSEVELPWNETVTETVDAEESDTVEVFPASIRGYGGGDRTEDITSLNIPEKVKEWDAPGTKELVRVRKTVSRCEAEEVEYTYKGENYHALQVTNKSGKEQYIHQEYPKKTLTARTIESISRFLG